MVFGSLAFLFLFLPIVESTQRWRLLASLPPHCLAQAGDGHGAAAERAGTAVVFGDSFIDSLLPQLRHSFDRVELEQRQFSRPRVLRHAPDVVIQQIAERNLDALFEDRREDDRPAIR